MMQGSAEKKRKAEEDKTPGYDEESVTDMKTFLEGTEDKTIRSVHDLPGTLFYSYPLGYNKEFRDHLREYYDILKEGSHRCVVLKKVVKGIDPTTKREVTRVIYEFDERHVKNFKKRVDKYKLKGYYNFFPSNLFKFCVFI